MDSQTLAEAMGHARGVDYARLIQPFNEAMIMADVTNSNRAAMWCAQLGHESSGLSHMNEIWGPTAQQRTYDGRMENRPGTSDWSDFRGRGPIQLTGRYNYRMFSEWAFSKGLVGSRDHFLSHPSKVAEPKWGFLAATWYWTVSRPQLNYLSDNGWIYDATRAINGGTTGIDDRMARYTRCLRLGDRLLPSKGVPMERVLDYSRSAIGQDTYYWCGPATAQTIIRAHTGNLYEETRLAREMGTHTGGTDHIGLLSNVLNQYLPEGKFRNVMIPGNDATSGERDTLWQNVVRSIDAGYGVAANIVAPANNYPRGTRGSSSPAYSGGTVFHYVSIMGYAEDGSGRHFWIADSGFAPYGYWASASQVATLIANKGYSYATGGTAVPVNKEGEVSFTEKDRQMLQEIHREQTQHYPSRSHYRGSDSPVDSWVGMDLNAEARLHEMWVEHKADRYGITPNSFLKALDDGAKQGMDLRAVCNKFEEARSK